MPQMIFVNLPTRDLTVALTELYDLGARHERSSLQSEAEHLQVLPRLVPPEIHDLGLELRGEPHDLRALARGQLLHPGAVLVAPRHGLLVHVRHVERRLGRYEGAHGLGQSLCRRIDDRRTPVGEVVA